MAGALALKDGIASWDGGEKLIADVLGGAPLAREGHSEPGDISDDFTSASYGAFLWKLQ